MGREDELQYKAVQGELLWPDHQGLLLSEGFHLMLSGCLPDGQHGIDRNVFHALHQHAQNSKFD